MIAEKAGIVAKKYQKTCIDALHSAFSISLTALFVMAMGLGKTITVALWLQEVLQQKQKLRVLFLCHNNDILEQSLAEFRKVFGRDISMGLFHGETKNYEELTVLFASFQTMEEWKFAFHQDEFDIVIVDEAHHSEAQTYAKTLEYFIPKMLLGMTGTPDRLDGKNICKRYGEPVFVYELPDAIINGDLTRVEYHLIQDGIDNRLLKKICKEVLEKGERISVKQLNETIFIKSRDEAIARQVEEYRKENSKTIYFCENIQHIESIVDTFPNAKPYHSGLLRSEQKAIYEAFQKGSLQEIAVRDKFNEGINVPEASLGVFLRVTDSKNIWQQQLGRLLRLHEGKSHAVILDFVNNCERLIFVRDMFEQLSRGHQGKPQLLKDTLVLEGENFSFHFTDELKDIFELLDRITLPRYETIEEASQAVQALGIKSSEGYAIRYLEDPRLPGMPNRVYKENWEDWDSFLNRAPKYTYTEALLRMKELKWKTKDEYITKCYIDPKLPKYPYNKYLRTGEWSNWRFFLNGGIEYLSFEDFVLFMQTNKITGQEGYRKYRKAFPELHELPPKPDIYYGKSWHVLKGQKIPEEKYSFADAKIAVQRLGITGRDDYKVKHVQDSRLPGDPRKFYKGKGWDGYMKFCAIEEKVLITFDQFISFIREKNIQSYREYQKHYKESSTYASGTLPFNPSIFYKTTWEEIIKKAFSDL